MGGRGRAGETLTVSVAAPDLRVLTTRLHRLHGLADVDRVALERLPLRTAAVAAGQNIVWSGEPATSCAIILRGMAFGYKLTSEGGRQIVSFHLAGDLPDLQSLRFRTADTNIAAVSGCHVGYVPYGALSDLCSSRPGLAAVLWRETLLQAAILREWLLNIGRRDALASLGHLLCEVVVRQRIAGLASTEDCRFPFTQAMMGDALGLSTVHVNRVVKELRQNGLLDWDGRHLTVLDWEGLQRLADFDPAYLHLDPPPPD